MCCLRLLKYVHLFSYAFLTSIKVMYLYVCYVYLRLGHYCIYANKRVCTGRQALCTDVCMEELVPMLSNVIKPCVSFTPDVALDTYR